MRINTELWNAIWLASDAGSDFGMLVIEHRNDAVQKIPETLRPSSEEDLMKKANFYVAQMNFATHHIGHGHG